VPEAITSWQGEGQGQLLTSPNSGIFFLAEKFLSKEQKLYKIILMLGRLHLQICMPTSL